MFHISFSQIELLSWRLNYGTKVENLDICPLQQPYNFYFIFSIVCILLYYIYLQWMVLFPSLELNIYILNNVWLWRLRKKVPTHVSSTLSEDATDFALLRTFLIVKVLILLTFWKLWRDIKLTTSDTNGCWFALTFTLITQWLSWFLFLKSSTTQLVGVLLHFIASFQASILFFLFSVKYFLYMNHRYSFPVAVQLHDQGMSYCSF